MATYTRCPLGQWTTIWLSGVEIERVFISNTILKVALRELGDNDFADAANNGCDEANNSANGSWRRLEHGEAHQGGDEAGDLVTHGKFWKVETLGEELWIDKDALKMLW